MREPCSLCTFVASLIELALYPAVSQNPAASHNWNSAEVEPSISAYRIASTLLKTVFPHYATGGRKRRTCESHSVKII
jgi:hypothetical protein